MYNEKMRADALRRKAYLQGKMLVQKRFQPTFPMDHSFCVFCWAQISDFEEDLHDGFYEHETESWVCNICLEEFDADFDWTVIRSMDPYFYTSDREEDPLDIPLF